jgi:D-alanyl-D-alanine carboxypeptidase (penicillin-binding protein 5/6)
VLDGNNQIAITDGVKSYVTVEAKEPFRYVFVGNRGDGEITKELVLVKDKAPIEKGDVVAKVEYTQEGKLLGSMEIVAVETVSRQKYHHALYKLFQKYVNVN